MKNTNPTDKRPGWRDRFLEIARQTEAVSPVASARAFGGLRPRLRQAGFATVRRLRPPALPLA